MRIFRKKRCVKILKFVKLFSNKKLQTISFWQLEKRKRKKSTFMGEKKKTVLYLFIF